MSPRKRVEARVYSLADLDVECWCGAAVVRIPKALIGTTTESCGAPGCVPSIVPADVDPKPHFLTHAELERQRRA